MKHIDKEEWMKYPLRKDIVGKDDKTIIKFSVYAGKRFDGLYEDK